MLRIQFPRSLVWSRGRETSAVGGKIWRGWVRWDLVGRIITFRLHKNSRCIFYNSLLTYTITRALGNIYVLIWLYLCITKKKVHIYFIINTNLFLSIYYNILLMYISDKIYLNPSAYIYYYIWS